MVNPPFCGKDVAGETCRRIPGHIGECIPGSAYKMAINSQYGKGFQRSLLNLVPNRVKYLLVILTMLVWVQLLFDVALIFKLWG